MKRMSGPAAVLAVWAAILLVLALILWIAFLPGRWSSWTIALPFYEGLPIGVAVLLELGLAAYAVPAARRRRAAAAAGGERSLVNRFSLGATLVGIALPVILLGTAVGAWAYFVGLGILFFGIGNLVREELALRRALEELED